MKNPSPGSCLGGCGRDGEGTVPMGAALTTTMRRTPDAWVPDHGGYVVARGDGLLEQLPADAAGGREDRELHVDVPPHRAP